MFKNLKDDSKEMIKYYEDMFKNTNDKSILNKIVKVMNAWSNIIKRKNFSIEEKEIFKEAICESHEYIWFEAGRRLIKLMDFEKKANEIFHEVFKNKNWKPRFNVVALSKYFNKEFRDFILKNAINDNNSKIREKTADVILSKEDKNLLPILKNRLKIETNKNVIRTINFTLKKIHNLKRDKNGSLVFTINPNPKE